MKTLLIVSFIALSLFATAQQDSLSILRNLVTDLEQQVAHARYTELVQSMSQRSMLTPSYFAELKALIARQAFNFWKDYPGDPLVSHLNVYSALYYANKFLGYDSINRLSYNQAPGHDESVIAIEFGEDPRYFYSAGSDGRVLRWSQNDPKKIPTQIYQGDHLIKSLDVSRGDEWILVVTKDEGIILLDNREKIESLRTETDIIRDRELVQAAVFVPNESRLVVVTKSGELKIKGFSGSKNLGTTEEQVSSMAVNAQNQDIYLGSAAGQVEVWEDTLAAKIHLPESFAVNTMAISPDFQTMALGREKGDAILWDLQNEKLIRTISGHQSAITDVDFSVDGKLLLTASRDRTVRVWDLNDSKKLPLVLDDHNDWVMTATFDPSGEQIISGSRDNFIRFWPVRHTDLAERVCDLVSRNLTESEWREYIGTNIPYQTTCPMY